MANERHKKTYLSFETMKLLGPFTKRLLKVALKSGPRLNWMLSNPNGSSATVFTPSPKSPVANLCRSPLIVFNIHSLGFGVFREHVVMVEAKIIHRKQKKTIEYLLVKLISSCKFVQMKTKDVEFRYL